MFRKLNLFSHSAREAVAARPRRVRRRRSAASLFGGLIAALFAAGVGALPKTIEQSLAHFGVSQDDVSVLVLKPDGDDLLAHNPDVPRHPGSTIKLVTTFGVLDHLTPIHTFKTRVYRDGALRDGVLEGDLVLRGEGDPYLSSEEFWKLVRAVKREGITAIEGDLVIDTGYYDEPPADPGAFDGQPYRLYNTQPYPLLVNFKAHRFTFTARGQRVDIDADPPLPNLEIDNRLTVRAGACRGYQAGITVSPLTRERIRFSGRFPSGCRSYQLSRTFMPPTDYAYGMFKLYFAELGGRLEGAVREAAPGRAAELLFDWESRPLREIIVAVNKFSNNVMTRMLLMNLGAELFGPPASVSKGVRALKEVYARRGVETGDLVIANGSGLARETRISARTMGAVLDAANRSPWSAEFVSSLPIAGLDGTLRRRLKSSATRGRSHLKTGRLDGVSALAGFVHADDGGDYVVVFFMNHADAHRGVGNAVGDALIKWVQRRAAAPAG